MRFAFPLMTVYRPDSDGAPLAVRVRRYGPGLALFVLFVCAILAIVLDVRTIVSDCNISDSTAKQVVRDAMDH